MMFTSDLGSSVRLRSFNGEQSTFVAILYYRIFDQNAVNFKQTNSYLHDEKDS